jgi:hypothetical protein
MVYVINLVETVFIVIMYYSEMIYMYPTLLPKAVLICNMNVGAIFDLITHSSQQQIFGFENNSHLYFFSALLFTAMLSAVPISMTASIDEVQHAPATGHDV